MGGTSRLQPTSPGGAVAVLVGAGCSPPWGGGGGEVGGSSPAPRSWQHGCPRGHGDLLSAEAFVPLGRSCLIPLIAISIKVQRKVKAEKSLLS